MVKNRGEGLLEKSCFDTEQLPDDATNIVRNISPKGTKRLRVNFECLYLLNPQYHEEHNYFGSSFFRYYKMFWNEISEVAELHGWFQTILFILLHLVIITPIKILFNPPFIPRKWMSELKVEMQLPAFPGYTEKQRWCFARKLWFNHKADHVFDERDGIKVWEGFCFSEKEYFQIREHVWTRISYFVERSGYLKAAISHGLKETDLKLVEDSGLWVSYMALGYRYLRLMNFADAKSIPEGGFLIRFKWWHFHIFNGWARVFAKVEGEKSADEKGNLVVMHLYMLPCFHLPFKMFINTIYGIYSTQLKEILDVFS
jgi:hypothetical protein